MACNVIALVVQFRAGSTVERGKSIKMQKHCGRVTQNYNLVPKKNLNAGWVDHSVMISILSKQKSEITTAHKERERKKLTDANRIHTKLNQIDYMRYLTDSMIVIRDD